MSKNDWSEKGVEARTLTMALNNCSMHMHYFFFLDFPDAYS